MIRTWKVRGLVLLLAAPLLGVVPAAAGAEAGARKPPPRPRTHAEPKPKPKAKPGSKPKAKPKAAKPKVAKPKAEPKSKSEPKPRPRHVETKVKQAKPRAEHHAKGVALHTAAPEEDVIPGRTYEWTWTFRVASKTRPKTVKAKPNKGKTVKGKTVKARPVKLDTRRAKPHKAVFRTTLPKSLDFVSGERHCASSGRKVVCRFGAVRPGDKISGVLRAKVAKRAAPGQKISPRGTLTWGGTHVTKRFPAVRVAATADLAITESAPAKARAGAKIPYELSVRNLGPSTASSVTVRSRGPIRLVGRDTACLPRHGAYVCSVGSLRAGESRTLHLKAVPRESVRPGTVLESSWTAESPTTDADRANNRAVVRTRITARR
ncbi:DUF11 domain-containing protein [Spirillospora sp. NBC_00431]